MNYITGLSPIELSEGLNYSPLIYIGFVDIKISSCVILKFPIIIILLLVSNDGTLSSIINSQDTQG